MKMVDYRAFRLSKLNTPQFSHVKLLLFWPVFFLLFQFAEQIYHPDSYYIMHCSLDDLIPFCEWFLFPYLFWFIYLAGTVAFTFLFYPDTFRRLMRFIILTYTVALVIFLLFPTCQHLRPLTFQRDNLLTEITALFYQFDTNTNVCPSLHVVGAIAAMLALWECEPFNKPGWRAVNVTVSVLICLSTVFMKQHSALDVLAALPLCLLGQFLFFRRQSRFYSGDAPLFSRRREKRKALHAKGEP
ncbi:MAG: phosphatase PAP2 family protein [Oscillospiraceae bacterium]|nr:phosphatase PAP2 family protein [Oscillospiraceae bacterium]